MTPYIIIAQVIGLFGPVTAFISFQTKKNRTFYMLQGISGAFYAISLFMLGAYTGSVFNVITVLRGGILALGAKGHKLWILIMLQVMFTASAILTYAGPLSILTLAAQVVTTFAMWSQNGKTIRIVQLSFSSPIWLIHNIYVLSIAGIIGEAFNIISTVISFVRFGPDGFEKR